jgi:hypothetical protein
MEARQFNKNAEELNKIAKRRHFYTCSIKCVAIVVAIVVILGIAIWITIKLIGDDG